MNFDKIYLEHASTKTIRVADVDLKITSVADTNRLMELHAGDKDFFPVGAASWGSGFALCEWLNQNSNTVSDVDELLELGCGVGVTATWLAKKFGLKVLATDHDTNVRELVTMNAKDNDVDQLVQFQTLDWRNPPQGLKLYQAIVGSDIIYDKDSIDPLTALIKQKLRPNGLFITCNPMRYQFEEAIQNLSKIFRNHVVQKFPVTGDRDYVVMIGNQLA